MIEPNKMELKDSVLAYASTVARDTGRTAAMSVFGRDAAKSEGKNSLSSSIIKGASEILRSQDFSFH